MSNVFYEDVVRRCLSQKMTATLLANPKGARRTPLRSSQATGVRGIFRATLAPLDRVGGAVVEDDPRR
jgi:hypothetical protein